MLEYPRSLAVFKKKKSNCVCILVKFLTYTQCVRTSHRCFSNCV